MNSTRASGAVVTSGGSLRGDARTGWHAWPTEGHCSELAASDRVNTPRPRGRGRRRGEARPGRSRIRSPISPSLPTATRRPRCAWPPPTRRRPRWRARPRARCPPPAPRPGRSRAGRRDAATHRGGARPRRRARTPAGRCPARPWSSDRRRRTPGPDRRGRPPPERNPAALAVANTGLAPQPSVRAADHELDAVARSDERRPGARGHPPAQPVPPAPPGGTGSLPPPQGSVGARHHDERAAARTRGRGGAAGQPAAQRDPPRPGGPGAGAHLPPQLPVAAASEHLPRRPRARDRGRAEHHTAEVGDRPETGAGAPRADEKVPAAPPGREVRAARRGGQRRELVVRVGRGEDPEPRRAELPDAGPGPPQLLAAHLAGDR